jgi:hypothetical protein
MVLTKRNVGERENDLCVMCDASAEEIVEHLFFTCSFARGYWSKINLN